MKLFSYLTALSIRFPERLLISVSVFCTLLKSWWLDSLSWTNTHSSDCRAWMRQLDYGWNIVSRMLMPKPGLKKPFFVLLVLTNTGVSPIVFTTALVCSHTIVSVFQKAIITNAIFNGTFNWTTATSIVKAIAESLNFLQDFDWNFMSLQNSKFCRYIDRFKLCFINCFWCWETEKLSFESAYLCLVWMFSVKVFHNICATRGLLKHDN